MSDEKETVETGVVSENGRATGVTDDGRVLEIISRAEAQELGLKRYFTGKACKHGHVGERLVINRACLTCSMEAHRNREKKKRQQNKLEKQKQLELEEAELDLKFPNRISREEAQKLGKRTYFTGKPCKHGHIAERCTRSTACVVCQKQHWDKENKKRRDETALKRQREHEVYLDKKKRDPRIISKVEARELGLTRYFTGEPCVNGHLAERYVSDGGCVECALMHSRNFDRRHPEKRRASTRRSRNKHRDVRNEEKRNRRQNDESYLIKSRYSARIRNAVRYWGGEKAYSSAELLGCTVPEFIEYLKGTMTEDMTWEAFLKGEIHIDHVKPLASFPDLTQPEQQKEAFHYSNHQLLWKADNLSKGAKYKGVDYRKNCHTNLKE